MNNIFIGEIARDIRRLKRVSLNSASEALCVCTRTLSRAERGEAPFLVGYLLPLAKCYGIAPADFFYFNSKTKRFEKPEHNHSDQLNREIDTLRLQVRQLTEYIQLLQNVSLPDNSLHQR